MADTQRSQSDLLTILADNTTRAISPQVARDVLVSVHGVYGAMYTKGGSTAQASIGTSFVKITGFATDGASSGTTPDNANDEIVVGTAGVYFVAFQISFSGTNSETFTFNIHKADVEGAFQGVRKLGTGGDVGSMSVVGCITCAASDALALYVKATGASKSITPVDMQLFIFRIA